MPRPTRWPQLLPGLAIVLVIVVGVVLVLTKARVGGVRGETRHLYATFTSARDVLAGSEVWLDGQKVGIVTDVRFLPPSMDTTARILVAFDMLAAPARQLRRDVRADVRAGGTMIGAPVIYLRSGTGVGGPLQPGDTIRAIPRTGLDELTARASLATKQLPALVADLRAIAGHVKSASGSVAPIMDRGAIRQVEGARAQAGALLERLTRGKGVVSMRTVQADLPTRVRHVTLALDSVRQLVGGSGSTSFGRFRRDSTLTTTLESLRAELAALDTLAHGVEGTAGRLASDSMLTNQVSRIDAEIAALIADIKRRPFRYLAF